MERCNDFQPQMLDYVYDLLEEDVARALDAHLEVCPACQLALRDAQAQQQLLATAARIEFREVTFAPPAPEPVLPQRPTVLPLVPARPRRQGLARRWLAAAAVLFSLALPGWLAGDYFSARRQVERHEGRIAALRAQTEKLDHDHAALRAKEAREQDEAEKKVRAESVHLSVIGPKTLAAGQPAELQIAALDGDKRPVAARITSVRVKDEANGKVLFEEKDLAAAGRYRLVLPPDLPVNPNSRLKIELVAKGPGGAEGLLREDFLLTPPQYLTHLATDKPMYQPGELIHFRSLTLERFSLEPAKEKLDVQYTLIDPDGTEAAVPQGKLLFSEQQPLRFSAVFGPDNKTLRGIGGGEYELPPDAAGGEWALRVSDTRNRFPAQTRKFVVNQYSKPRLAKALDFTRKSYGPGDDVTAAVQATRAEGGPVADCPVKAEIQIDGKRYGANGQEVAEPFGLKTDANGKLAVQFKLPRDIDRGLASLNLSFEDGGSPDPLTKPIPIVLKKLDVEFFPEGGYLVPNVPNRVYFRARTTLGRPAEVRGRVIDDLGDEVAVLHTLNDDEQPGVNQGMGVFTLTPHRGRNYRLLVDSPSGVEARGKLTTDRMGVVSLSVPSAVTASHEPIDVRVRSVGEDRTLLVGAYCRGRLFDHQTVQARDGQDVRVELSPEHGAGGVFRVTVFEVEQTDRERPALIPRAERLVYRRPAQRLNLDVTSDRADYQPGDRAKVKIKATGENQEPVSPVVMVGVVDKSLLTMADEKTARSMPTHFYLGSEVEKPEELEYADFLLTTHPRAPAALDLLLGTQGWRRFTELSADEIRKKVEEREDVAGATLFGLARELPRITRGNDRATNEAELEARIVEARHKVAEGFDRDEERLNARQDEARMAVVAAFEEPAYDAARDRLDGYARFAAVLRLVFPVVGMGLLIAACLLLGRALGSPVNRSVPSMAAGLACLLLLVFGGFFAFQGVSEQPGVPMAGDTRQMAQENVPMASPLPKATAPPKDVIPVPEIAPGNPLPGKEERSEEKKGEGKREESWKDVPFTQPPQPDTMTPRPAAPSPIPPPVAPTETGRDSPPPGASGWTIDSGKAGSGKDQDSKQGVLTRPTDRKPRPGDPRDQAGGKKKGDSKEGKNDGKEGGDDKTNRANLLTPLRGTGGESGDPKGAAAFDEEGTAREALERFRSVEKRRAEFQRLDQQRRQLLGGRAVEAPDDSGQPKNSEGGKYAQFELGYLYVREYAHQPPAKADPNAGLGGFGTRGARFDTTETVYWHPALVLADGSVDVGFALNQDVTSYEVTVYGHTLDGRLATARHTLHARLPLTVSPSLPREVSSGDRLDLPVTVTSTAPPVGEVTVRLNEVKGLELLEKQTQDALKVEPNVPTRRVWSARPSVQEGVATVEVEARSQSYSDAVRRDVRIVPDGFPVERSVGDLLEGSAKHTVELPQNWSKGTLAMEFRAYPSTLADLQKGLDGLLREPNGCFEQTSSANYPNLLILDYLKQTKQARPEVERRAYDLLDRGYEKLLTFECQDPARAKKEGYEWFGGTAPPHESLTAYGLLQFKDLTKVRDVDRAMMERTRNYLLGRRDGKGGFLRNPKAIDGFGRAPEAVTNAYVVWALTETGSDDLSKELNALVEQAQSSKDAYFLSLVANSLVNRARTADAVKLLRKVADAQKPDGHLDGGTTSITGSGGRDLQIETTALAVLGWLKADPGGFHDAVRKATDWINKQRGGSGAFGSSQATVLALKALIAHTKAHPRPTEAGQLALFVGDTQVSSLTFSATVSDALVLQVPNPEKHLKPGKNAVRVEMTGKSRFPYTLAWSYRATKPANDRESVVALQTKLDRPVVKEGESVRLTVQVSNASDKGQGMAVAVVGLPGGLVLPEDLKQLRQYKEVPKDGSRPLVSAFEVRGRELVLYWRDLAPGQKIEVPIDLSCRIPGEYSGPASRSYLYYNGDHKTWVEPLRIHITPK